MICDNSPYGDWSKQPLILGLSNDNCDCHKINTTCKLIFNSGMKRGGAGMVKKRNPYRIRPEVQLLPTNKRQSDCSAESYKQGVKIIACPSSAPQQCTLSLSKGLCACTSPIIFQHWYKAAISWHILSPKFIPNHNWMAVSPPSLFQNEWSPTAVSCPPKVIWKLHFNFDNYHHQSGSFDVLVECMFACSKIFPSA